VTGEDLKEAFSPYGDITDVKVIVGKRCGFVTYSSRYLFYLSLYFVQYIVVVANQPINSMTSASYITLYYPSHIG
jgi:hypothetical protein